MWKYSQKVMDHFLNPRNAGELEDANAVGQVGSLVCGDSLKISLRVDPQTERILEAKFLTFGCGSAIASASALTELIKGKTLDEAKKLTDRDIADYLGGLPEAKMHCSVMGTDALRAAIAVYRGEEAELSGHADEGVVCACFGVTRKKIEDVVREHGLTAVEQVTHFTKAGGACGKCRPKIADIIGEVTGARPEVKPVEAPRRMTNVQRMRKVEEALEKEIRPALRADGGDIELVDVDGATVTVSLAGRCRMCAAAGSTLRGFVEAKLRELVEPDVNVVEARETAEAGGAGGVKEADGGSVS